MRMTLIAALICTAALIAPAQKVDDGTARIREYQTNALSVVSVTKGTTDLDREQAAVVLRSREIARSFKRAGSRRASVDGFAAATSHDVYFGAPGAGVFLAQDEDGDGSADLIRYPFRHMVSPSALAFYQGAENLLWLTDHSGIGAAIRLKEAGTNKYDPAFAKYYTGVADSLYVNSANQVWLGSANGGTLLQYEFTPQAATLPDANRLGGTGYSNISMAYGTDMAVYIVDLWDGALRRVPTGGSFGLQWDYATVVTRKYPRATKVACDVQQGKLYLLVAGEVLQSPPMPPLPGVPGSSGAPEPQAVLLQEWTPRIVVFRLTGRDPVEEEVIELPTTPRVNLSPFSGLAVADGIVYFVANNFSGDEIMRWDTARRMGSTLVPAAMFGRPISALAIKPRKP